MKPDFQLMRQCLKLRQSGVFVFGLACAERAITITFHQRRDFRCLDIVGAICRRGADVPGCVGDIVFDAAARTHLDQRGSKFLFCIGCGHLLCQKLSQWEMMAFQGFLFRPYTFDHEVMEMIVYEVKVGYAASNSSSLPSSSSS